MYVAMTAVIKAVVSMVAPVPKQDGQAQVNDAHARIRQVVLTWTDVPCALNLDVNLGRRSGGGIENLKAPGQGPHWPWSSLM